MEEENFILRPLAPENVSELLTVLKNLLPDSAIAYHSVLIQQTWASKIPGVQLIVLCPNGDWRDGTMVQLTEGLAVPNKLYGTIYAQEDKLEVLRKGLLETKLIDWSRLKQISAVPARLLPLLKQVLHTNGFTEIGGFKEICNLNYMAAEDAANAPLPPVAENLRVGPLSANELQCVCDNWAYYSPIFRPVVLQMLELNMSMGVFEKNEKGEEELVSMVVESEYGGVGLMQTVPKHRRKGFGKIVLAHHLRNLGNHGRMPFGLIWEENQASTSLFGQFGFKKGGLYSWIKMKPI